MVSKNMKTFIEVGAADFDTLIDFNWRGIICEPHPIHFNKLFSNNKNPNIKVLDIAISDSRGKETFYGPSQEFIDYCNNNKENEWIKGISGFLRKGFENRMERIIRENNHPDSFLFKKEVQKITLDELIYTNKIRLLDFLKVDTEGHDFRILNAYNWDVRPTFIKCEHTRSDDPDIYTEKIFSLFDNKGYKYWEERGDIYAIDMQ